MKKPNLKQKLSYWFDNLMSKGTLSLIFVLAVITILVVFITGIVVSISDPEANGNIFQAAWMSLMHALDAGTIAGDDTIFILVKTEEDARKLSKKFKSELFPKR